MAGSSAQWTTRSAFLLASIGFAVGLGNIWRFPYVVGENGGAAFIAVYLVCVFAIGAPILIAELLIGRRGGGSPERATRAVAQQASRSHRWGWLGAMTLVTAFAIVVTYSVVAGWVLAYLSAALTGGLATATAEIAQSRFDALLATPGWLMFWTALGLTLTGLILAAGLKSGVERAVRILMPLLFILMLAMAVYNAFAGGFGEAVSYLLTPDFSKLSANAFLAAVGQAFFSIGVAMAGMMTFGAYLPRDYPIVRSALIIVSADTLVALVAGLVVFPAVFRYGLDVAGGPGLIFQTLPVAFERMPAGGVIASLFFLLLSVAAVTSMVGLVEPLVRSVQEKFDMARRRATLAVMSAIAAFAGVSVLGYNIAANVSLFGRDINSAVDFVSNQILLPVGGLLIAVFAGWVMSAADTRSELHLTSDRGYRVWRLLVRFVSPIAVLVILVTGLQ
ncbi:MAG: sodium-dependent transporter [Pseudomonadaceae bacterium]|nr:sodium-dependent transporter [Pseudomonadaceae bacterium]